MRLRDLLRAPLIRIRLRASTRDEAIEELIDVLVAEGEVSGEDRARVAKAIFERERSRSTGMEYGVALPHGAVEGIEEVAAALGIARPGIDWGAADGRPADLIVLLAIPQNMLQFHVKTLAGIARLLNDETLRERLRAVRTPAEAVDAIREGEEGQI